MRGQKYDWDPTTLSIRQAPAPREVYWIGVFEDAVEPEFTGYHPGVIIGTAGGFNQQTGTVTFVPLTSLPPPPDSVTKVAKSKYSLMKNPHPSDSRPVWAVCNHLITVRLTRLERYKDGHRLVVPKISKDDFDNILSLIIHNHAALRNHIQSNQNRMLDDLKKSHEDAILHLKREFERALEAKAYELLDDMTKPNIVIS